MRDAACCDRVRQRRDDVLLADQVVEGLRPPAARRDQVRHIASARSPEMSTSDS